MNKYKHVLDVIIYVASLLLDVIMITVAFMVIVGHKADQATLILTAVGALAIMISEYVRSRYYLTMNGSKSTVSLFKAVAWLLVLLALAGKECVQLFS